MNSAAPFHPLRFPTAAVAAALLALVGATGGCSSLAARPAQTGQPPLIIGDWQRDAQHSDDFDAKLGQLLKERQQRLRARHGMGGARRGGEAGNGARDGRDYEILELPQEESDRFRTRMIDDLRPPRVLRITSDAGGEAIEVRHDAETAGRRYLPGQTVSRIDDSGAAQITCGWEQQAFEVNARYVHNAARSWRYEVEPASGMLLLRFEVNDPEIGHLVLASRYRRQTP
jgi:hypothetical protein